MKKILVVTTVDPYPKKNGKAVVLGGLYDYFSKRKDDITVLTVSFGEDDPYSKKISRPKIYEAIWNFLLLSFLKNEITIQESFFLKKENIKIIQDLVNEFAPDYIFFDTFRSEVYRAYLSLGSCKVITYLEDLFSLRYKRVLESSEPAAAIYTLGNFANKLPHVATLAFARSRILREIILKYESRAALRSERRCLESSSRSLLISADETRAAQVIVEGSLVSVFPPRLSASFLERRWNDSPEFIFLGSLNLAHNLVGIESFLDTCLSDLLGRMPNATLKIIGSGVSESIKRYCSLYPANVFALGFVDDIATHLSTACALIAPLTFGSGVKIKIIDALSAGLPIVATPVGIEGVNFLGRSVAVASSADDFVDAMLALAERANNEIASADSLRTFESMYHHSVVDNCYDQIFEVSENSTLR